MRLISAVLVDNGEPLLRDSFLSLKNQVDEVIIAPGPKSDLNLAEELADRVVDPMSTIGKGRVRGIQKAKGNFIISSDSDTIYHPGYVDAANLDLQFVNAVKAGRVLPYEWNTYSAIESAIIPFLPYEFSLAFRKDAFMDAGIDRMDYSLSRGDIGFHVGRKLLPFPDPRMVCSTRLPTHYGVIGIRDYLPSAIAAGAIVGVVSLVPIVNEILKLFHSKTSQ